MNSLYKKRLSAHGLIPLLIYFSSISGCAISTSPLESFANQQGFIRTTFASNGFVLTVFYNQTYLESTNPHKRQNLNIYIDGDGRPWTGANKTKITRDPTGQSPTLLTLMAMDPNPAIYIARPCYFNQSKKCDPMLWTFARYGKEVIDTLLISYQHWSKPFVSVNLIGFSGGGTLAMLIAPRLMQTKKVVTLAGNLDIDKWADHHGYSRLVLSVNPATQIPLPKQIEQLHIAAANDKNVLPEFISSVAERENANIMVFPEIDHTCCWQEVWPAILNHITNR